MSSATTHGQVLRFVWKHARGHRFKLAVIVVQTIVVTVLSLAQPLFFRNALNVLSATPTFETFSYAQFMLLLGVASIGLGVLVEQWSRWYLAKIEIASIASVSKEAFTKAQRLSTDFHVNEFAGATVRKITRGVDAIEGIYDHVFMTFLPAVTITIGLIAVLGFYAPSISLVMLIGITLFILCSIGFNLIVMRFNVQADMQDSIVTGNMVDAITANAVVKSFAAEKSEDARHAALLQKWGRHQWIAWRIATGLTASQYLLLIILEAVIWLVSLDLWRRGLFSPGMFVVIVVYVWQVWSKLWDIGRTVRRYVQSISHASEMIAIVQEPLIVEDIPKAKALKVTKGVVSFNDISFQYANLERSIFENFSLAIKAGETIALVGHSGGGKSTIVKLLLRLYDVQRGSITIDDQNIAHVTQESLRRAIGLVPQEPILFHRSIAENISYGKPHATKKQIEEAARKAHAHEFIKLLPKGYDTHVGERGVKLSGGERQRVALARTILADAPILVLDEATSSLDSVSEKYIQDALEYLMKDRTTIVIAHRLSTIKRADRIIVLSEGKIAELGSHDQLLAKKDGIYKHLYELQAGGFLGDE